MQLEKEPHLLLTNVLFSVRVLISNRTVSSFIITSKQTAVFFWQSIGAALVDGIIWEFAKSAKAAKLHLKIRRHYADWSYLSYDILCSVSCTLQNEMNNRQNLTSYWWFWLGNLDLDFETRILHKMKCKKEIERS